MLSWHVDVKTICIYSNNHIETRLNLSFKVLTLHNNEHMKKSTRVVRAHTRLEPPSVQTNKIIITLNSEKLLLTTLNLTTFITNEPKLYHNENSLRQLAEEFSATKSKKYSTARSGMTGVRFLFVMQFFGRVIYTAED